MNKYKERSKGNCNGRWNVRELTLPAYPIFYCSQNPQNSQDFRIPKIAIFTRKFEQEEAISLVRFSANQFPTFTVP